MEASLERNLTRQELDALPLETQIQWWRWRFRKWLDDPKHLSPTGENPDAQTVAELKQAGVSSLEYRLTQIELMAQITLPDCSQPSAGEELTKRMDQMARMHTELISKLHTATRFHQTLAGLLTLFYAPSLSPAPLNTVVKGQVAEEAAMAERLSKLADSISNHVWTAKNSLERWIEELRSMGRPA